MPIYVTTGLPNQSVRIRSVDTNGRAIDNFLNIVPKPDVKYNDDVIIQTLENETKKQVGHECWLEITRDLELPNIEMPQDEASGLTRTLMQRFDSLVEGDTRRRILTNVQHGLTPGCFPGLREKFLKYGKIDTFAAAIHQELLDEIIAHRDAGKLWYGQVIEDSVVEMVKNQPHICYGARAGSTLRCIAIPNQARDTSLKPMNGGSAIWPVIVRSHGPPLCRKRAKCRKLSATAAWGTRRSSGRLRWIRRLKEMWSAPPWVGT